MKRGPKRVRTSISCTPAEWARIQALADRAGLSETAFLMTRALDDEPQAAAAARLAADAQDAFVTDVRWLCDSLVRPVPDSVVTAQEAIWFLAIDQHARLVRAGGRPGGDASKP